MSSSGSAASRGALGGSSGDSGVEYRRGVAAYAAACGLAGVPLAGLDIADEDARVKAVVLETDAAVDDIRVIFTSGWVADVQAKRYLRKGAVFEKAVAQWVEAGRLGLDPNRQRLVIAAGRLSGPMHALREVLNRRRLYSPGGATGIEAETLTYLESLLGRLSEDQRKCVLDTAVIWEISVEEPEHPSAREAMAHLGNVGVRIPSGDAGNVWSRLCATAGRLARLRGGYDLAGWLSALRGVGLIVAEPGDNPAGQLERRRAAVERYAERLVREARELDLRALGAELPPLAFADADACVQVGINPDDDREHKDLMWAFLRRHRVVLTGLPGAGKSTALRLAAGQLAERLLNQLRGEQPGDPAYPFPVRASLKQINALNEGRSFRERLTTIAFRDDSATDRDILTAEINRRLEQDLPIALFLDALDETYDDRGKVISQVHSFLAGLPDSPFVLIATRDIAYGQAATLEWADLRLLAPERVDAVVTAVLEAAAAHERVTDAAGWVKTRRTWVDQVLGQDPALKETPLIPTLLSLLAVERLPERLPKKRAEVLQEVMADVMQRHENPRHNDRLLKNLTGNCLGTAAMHAYATEAAVLLDNGGVATIDQVVDAVSTTLAKLWGLAPGPAQAAARDAVRFLDETGLFVLFEPDNTVTARLSLFAEIGDAINAIQHPELASEWANRRIEGHQLESVALAAALDEKVNHAWQDQLRARPGDLDLVRGMLRAREEGTLFTDETTTRLRSELLISIERGNRDGWSDWRRLMALGVPDELVTRAVAAAAKHSTAHGLLATAALALCGETIEAEPADESALLELLTIHNLPKSKRETSARRGLEGITIDHTLSDTQLSAAKELLRRETPGAVEAILARARNSSTSLADSLTELLVATGHQAAANQLIAERAERWNSHKLYDWLRENREADRYPHFLALVAKADHGQLTTRQRVELAELGDFVETLDMNDLGVISLYRQADDFLLGLIELTCTLFGFDRSVLAAQAQVMLDRLQRDQTISVYFTLFDTAKARDKANWEAVGDPKAAVDLLTRMLGMSLSQAHFAATCLWGSSIAAVTAEPILRDLMTRFTNHPRHQYVIASTLASLPGVTDMVLWSESPDPVLRRVAAQVISPLSSGQLDEKFQPLLSDEDGYVRETALEELAEIDFPGRESLLSRLATQGRPGWKCYWCATQNPTGTSSCITSDCYSAAPNPAAKARELLERAHRERQAEEL